MRQPQPIFLLGVFTGIVLIIVVMVIVYFLNLPQDHPILINGVIL